MAQHSQPPQMTEPKIVSCLFMTGYDIEVTDSFVRIVGWVDLPVVGHDQPERRVIMRAVMPNNVARALQRDLRKGLTRGGH